MGEPNKILSKMLDRLLAGLMNGPSLNCRPLASRQRIDLTQIARLADVTPENVLLGLLGDAGESAVRARVPIPRGGAARRETLQKLAVAVSVEAADENGPPRQMPVEEAGEENAAPDHAWLAQQAVLQKLHTIAEDARTYEQDTGVHVLSVGFPLLSLAPGTLGDAGAGGARRVLAPVAFIPVSLKIRRGAATIVELSCKSDGVDRVTPNAALLAWLEQQSAGAEVEANGDERGAHPWRETAQLVAAVCRALEITVPKTFQQLIDAAAAAASQVKANAPALPENLSLGVTATPVDAADRTPHADASGDATEQPALAGQESGVSPIAPSDPDKAKPDLPDIPPEALHLEPAPKTEDLADAPAIICAAVLGLFPMANQGLLRDTQTMLGMASISGPIEPFLRREPHAAPTMSADASPAPVEAAPSPIAAAAAVNDEHFISGSDPCQARAVRMSRQCRGLVVHGPPGTGKSQTITNIAGDHLARGQRVLIVCDKRTALDVVFNRLEHMGLGNLCALVHDPRKDQRELYKSIRQQLDDLPDPIVDARAQARLEKASGELAALHEQLSRYHDALARRQQEHGATFGDLVGEWLSLTDAGDGAEPGDGVGLSTLETYTNEVADVLRRGELVSYGTNPWPAAAGIALGDFLAQPMVKIRATVRACEDAARAADATIDPLIPPLAPSVALNEQAAARAELAGALPLLLASALPQVLSRWATAPVDALTSARRKLEGANAFVKTFEAAPLDAELLSNVGDRPQTMLSISEQLARLAAYEELTAKWYAFLPLKPKKEAARVVNGYGLTLSPQSAARVKQFMQASRARVELSKMLKSLAGPDTGSAVIESTATLSDEMLARLLKDHAVVIDLMTRVRTAPGLKGLADRVANVLGAPELGAALVAGLTKSPPRAAALEKLESLMSQSRLFEAVWFEKHTTAWRAGQTSQDAFSSLVGAVETLEGVLRVRQGLNVLPVRLRSAVDQLLAASTAPTRAMEKLRREALSQEIYARLKADPHLQDIDGHRLEFAFTRYRELEELKRTLTRDAIRARSIGRQQERLLAQSRTRLNGTGADLRRRLMLRGEHAMRLRQVVDIGMKIEGGDPLFDFCPIWLCSPETVAQVFPLRPMFDLLVFDEASQMRLEESLPVLVRARRVVIAGDPKQLPPTRFFESAVVSREDDDAETDQELFEHHQGEIEDLLGAALGLDLQQCYLDVHYRSRHRDLIDFSNRHFYNSRLQPIPGRPGIAASEAAVVLEQVNGVYERRRNDIEAERIVGIIRELLTRPEPPSIGVACFNLAQRDLVAEKLDDLAASDGDFAGRLEKARALQGEGSFEGLFVKNLENVQGDERDYILISTTYGPDSSGRFYRRFGPLGRAGGGCRLNVLVTRARERVHVVTSVPPDAYRALGDLPADQAPSGAWLLLAYLKYAETAGAAHAAAQPARAALAEAEPSVMPSVSLNHPGAEPSAEASNSAVIGSRLETADHPTSGEERGDAVLDACVTAQNGHPIAPTENGSPAVAPPSPAGKMVAWKIAASSPEVAVLPTRTPSLFAQALAHRLAQEHGVSSSVYWGSDGFCIDLALQKSGVHDGAVHGVLCDTARYAAVDDPIRWDIFRTAMLESHGWTLKRVWTPHFFRDPQGVMRAVVDESAK